MGSREGQEAFRLGSGKGKGCSEFMWLMGSIMPFGAKGQSGTGAMPFQSKSQAWDQAWGH